jgi:hypothetical protein
MASNNGNRNAATTETTSTRRRVSRRVQSVLEGMSVMDKIGQMSQIDVNILLEEDPNHPGMKRISKV